MKFFVFVFCICFVQTCLSSSSFPFNVQLIRNNTISIICVSEKFIEDIDAILEKYPNDPVVISFLGEFIPDLAKLSKTEENSTIQVDDIKVRSIGVQDYKILDNLSILQTILLKHLPSERSNGLLNLVHAARQSATSEEIQSALNYLYGIETEAAFHNIPEMTLVNCSNSFESSLNANALAGLDSLIEIKPKAVQDITAIINRFPCQYKVASYMESFVRTLLIRLNGGASKINACKIKESGGNQILIRRVNMIETILQTRLPDETFRGILNLIKTFRPDAPLNEIEKALEYLYVDVPPTNC